jgi:2-(1,2-epoxy-1,2-dihydrophenyl)acetyl-CoA isomerase
MIDAKTALSLGIVNHVVPGVQLEAEVKLLARKIALGPGVAIRAVKKVLFGSEKKELSQALEQEVQEQIRCYLSEDCSEGIRAFFEKRPPKFQGK